MKEQKKKILGLIAEPSYTPMTDRDMIYMMSVPEEDKELFLDLIHEMKQDGQIVITKKGKIVLPEKMGLYPGIFRQNAKGYGFAVLDEEGQKDLFIPPNARNGAMHNDTVMVRIMDHYKREGEIIRVLRRDKSVVVGILERERNCGFVTPDDKHIISNIYIGKKDLGGAVTGQKVLVSITKFEEDGKKAQGKIVKIIGHKNEPGVDLLSILYEHQIPVDFPQEVIAQLDSIPDEVPAGREQDRLDLSDLYMITIDGEDTKDIDDAVSLIRLDNGNFQLGVHIADVTAYVREGSPLDREALKRGTSVYLLDKVVPMLPPKLSNGICSLNPRVPRLALSCIMEVNPQGEVVQHQIAPTYICVNRKCTYFEIDRILSGEQDSGKDGPDINMVQGLWELSGWLREKRNRRGAIEFSFEEAKIIMDEEGKPADIVLRKRTPATGIIEECMLAANETVAQEYYWAQLPFVYRNHEEPDEEKLRELGLFLAGIGYKVKGKGGHPKAIQALLAKAESKPEALVVAKAVLRSMKQARYNEMNIGHFGLASSCYCHFTSPIRRYPDLQIHRIIKENIVKGLPEKRISHYHEILPEVCKVSSLAERRAQEAERDGEQLKKVEYMVDKVGQEFDGVISGVTSWGIYVELPNTVEGMVAPQNMEDDDYQFYPDQMKYIGKYSGNEYQIGRKVRIQVQRANVELRRIDFVFVS